MIASSPARRPEEPRTVLLTFASLSWQKGSAAQVSSLVNELRRVRPHLRFRLLSHCPEIDEEAARHVGVDVVSPGFAQGASRNRRSAAMLCRRLIGSVGRNSSSRRRPGVEAPGETYRSADIVIDLSGDSYRDRPGGFALAHHANFLLALRSGTPYVLASQSIGPFWRPNRPIARYFLDRADLVYIRERRTEKILENLGVRLDRIHRAPDIAFALPTGRAAAIFEGEPLEPERLPRPWVGVSVSHLAHRLARAEGEDRYLEEMLRTVEHVHRRHGATVLLIPHEINPPYYGADDRTAAETLYERAGRPTWLHPIRKDYGPSILKGLIGECDALIASRMHAGIAALSSGVPTVFAAWSHKYRGLMEEIGLAEFVWDQRDRPLPGTGLTPLFDRLWSRRTSIRVRLLEYTARAQREIGTAIRRIADCIPPSAAEGREATPRLLEQEGLP